ncbi:nucleoside kinase [Chloroflexota bacterium]
MENQTPVPSFQIVSPSENVEIYLPDGRVLSGPRNAKVGEFFRILPEKDDPPIVGAIVNGELRELTYPIKIDSHVRPVTMSQADGMRIYRRSLIFLLEASFDKCYPEAILKVNHSVSSGGYYCEVSGRPHLTEDEIKSLEAHMWELVEADQKFTRSQVPLPEAIAYFDKQGEDDKVRLLSHRRKNYLTLYQLNEHHDYHHGYMVPSTGFLRWFRLTLTGDGFTLRFPRRHAPTQLLAPPEYPKLLNTFRRYGNWLELLDISSVGALNDAIRDERIQEVILVSEALHELRISEIANHIAEQSGLVRVVTVAGPSSSGKTTLSKRLTVQLLAHGISPFPLAMDNYFVNREHTPIDEDGKLDFESIDALNRERLASDLNHLIEGEKVQLPRFNFISGQSEEGDIIQLKPDQIIIIEGIHGLNPALLTNLPEQRTVRIYISALTQLNLDRHNRISTTDTRLLRRIVRDARERGYSAVETIQRWESVRRGEKRYIFPYQENADLMFNSALVYEVSALKPLAEPLLRQVPHGTPEFVEAKRLLAFLEWFLPLPAESDLIPDNSLLREFIGGSTLRDFSLWHQNNP